VNNFSHPEWKFLMFRQWVPIINRTDRCQSSAKKARSGRHITLATAEIRVNPTKSCLRNKIKACVTSVISVSNPTQKMQALASGLQATAR
jgi:hypothetical protein